MGAWQKNVEMDQRQNSFSTAVSQPMEADSDSAVLYATSQYTHTHTQLSVYTHIHSIVVQSLSHVRLQPQGL